MRHRHGRLTLLLLALAGCGGGGDNPDANFQLPAGDPDGGSVQGTITTDLQATAGGHLYIGAFENTDGGQLLVGLAAGEVAFPYMYEVDGVPGGQRVIRALLDLPPYAARPLVDPPGVEDAIGVYLNANSILPVIVRPGATTTRVDFFVTRTR